MRQPIRDVGEACRPSEVPAGGFDGTESVVERLAACDDACLVLRHVGDLEPDPAETQESIDEDVYCTCSCGNVVCGDSSDIRCPVCPEGFECCSLGADVECAPGMVSSWCVRQGLCPE